MISIALFIEKLSDLGLKTNYFLSVRRDNVDFFYATLIFIISRFTLFLLSSSIFIGILFYYFTYSSQFLASTLFLSINIVSASSISEILRVNDRGLKSFVILQLNSIIFLIILIARFGNYLQEISLINLFLISSFLSNLGVLLMFVPKFYKLLTLDILHRAYSLIKKSNFKSLLEKIKLNLYNGYFLPISLTILFASFLHGLDLIILSQFTNEDQFGKIGLFYTFAEAIINFAMIPITFIIMPKFVQKNNQEAKYVFEHYINKIFTPLIIIVFPFIFLFFYVILPFFFTSFDKNSITTLYIIFGVIYPRILSLFYGIIIFTIKEHWIQVKSLGYGIITLTFTMIVLIFFKFDLIFIFVLLLISKWVYDLSLFFGVKRHFNKIAI